ncbi:hypothetical protein [Herbidospora sp. RD11066]
MAFRRRPPRDPIRLWLDQSDQWHPTSLGDETAMMLAGIAPSRTCRSRFSTPIPAAHVI